MQAPTPRRSSIADRHPGRERAGSARSRSRSLAALALACGPALALSACGGANAPSAGVASAHPSTALASNASIRQSGPAKRRAPSRAQALAFARAVNLSVADIPEASRAPRVHTRFGAGEQRELQACERLVRAGHTTTARQLLGASSPRLKRGSELEVEEFSSAVTVLSDERAVIPEFATLKSSAVRACVAHVLTRYFSEKAIREAHWGRVTISSLPIDAPGASDTVGIRVSVALTLSFSEIAVPIYVDVLGFAIGPAEVALTAASVTQPVPAATEQELVSLLLVRAKARASSL